MKHSIYMYQMLYRCLLYLKKITETFEMNVLKHDNNDKD